MGDGINAENERQYEVVDQMLTMHSSYRDIMQKRAFWLNVFLIAGSVLVTVLGFLGDEVFFEFNLNAFRSRFFIGLAGVFLLILSFIEFKVDWKALAGRHAEAAAKIAALKLRYRRVHSGGEGEGLDKLVELSGEFEKTMGQLPAIPDGWFNKLKSLHQFKKLLSQEISRHPTTPYWLLRVKLRFKGVKGAFENG